MWRGKWPQNGERNFHLIWIVWNSARSNTSRDDMCTIRYCSVSRTGAKRGISYVRVLSTNQRKCSVEPPFRKVLHHIPDVRWLLLWLRLVFSSVSVTVSFLRLVIKSGHSFWLSPPSPLNVSSPQSSVFTVLDLKGKYVGNIHKVPLQSTDLLLMLYKMDTLQFIEIKSCYYLVNKSSI